MKLKVIVHDGQEGGSWAEVPAIQGCVAQGDTFDESFGKLDEAVEGCLSVDMSALPQAPNWRIVEIAV